MIIRYCKVQIIFAFIFMEKYLEIFINSFGDYFNYLKSEILNPGWTNYFYWLIALSLLVMLLEIILPWRKNQKILRKGFFLDVFYILFNFFLFSLVGYNAISNVGVALFNDFPSLFNIDNLVAIQVGQLPGSSSTIDYVCYSRFYSMVSSYPTS